MFSILNDWQIRYSRSKVYGAQCSIHPTKKEAVIYPWNAPDEPEDYKLHEYLHIAIRALNRIDRRKHKEYRQAEEILVQEICQLKL